MGVAVWAWAVDGARGTLRRAALLLCASLGVSCASPTTSFVFTELTVSAVDREGAAVPYARLFVTFTADPAVSFVPYVKNHFRGDSREGWPARDFKVSARAGPDGVAQVYVPGIWYQYLRWKGIDLSFHAHQPPLPTIQVVATKPLVSLARAAGTSSAPLSSCGFSGTEDSGVVVSKRADSNAAVVRDESGFGHLLRVDLICEVSAEPDAR